MRLRDKQPNPENHLLNFVSDVIREPFHGSRAYFIWLAVLLAMIAFGAYFYTQQLMDGLIVTNMSNQVSWGFYIANFTFLVGVAAAAVMLVIPAYVFHRKDIKDVVLVGDTMAIAAVTMAILFVLVDLGRPDRIWHLIPGIGKFNFPVSMLAWDVLVLNGYLILNFAISAYILFQHYKGKKPKESYYFPVILLAIFWAISIHTITAFLYAANSGRAFWHSALLAPKFIASAFCSGPAIMALGLQVIRKTTEYPISESVIKHLALTAAFALQITLFFIGTEIFTEFYNEGEHAASARYLFVGLDGHTMLTPWIWTSIILLLVAVTILMIHPLRNKAWTMNLAFVLTIIGVWIDKGMGFVIPGFVPTPIGEIYEYTPSLHEIAISIGIWGIGLLMFTLLGKMAIPIQCRYLLNKKRIQDSYTSGERPS